MKRAIRSFFAALVATSLWASVARAELNFEADTLDDGTPFILVSGKFSLSDDLSSFTALAARNNTRFVTFDSPGGNVSSALALGRMIRALRVNTIQLRQHDCSSACAFAFAGGVSRNAQPGSIGVHRTSFPNEPVDAKSAVSGVQESIGDVITYLGEMGVDAAILQLALKYDATDMRYLSLSEMEEFRLVTTHENETRNKSIVRREAPYVPPGIPAAAVEPPAVPPVLSARPSNPWNDGAYMPRPRTGVIRHAKGQIDLRVRPDTKAPPVARLVNYSKATILDVDGSWYRVSAGGKIGYAHTSWIKIDQYVDMPFNNRFIQIKSYSNRTEALAFIERAGLRLDAYLATNGWYAITLAGTYPEATAQRMVAQLKSSGTIPDDSYFTFGNTYTTKVCCN